MSKFVQNLLVQISKAFLYSKIQILFRNNSSQISAHPAQLLARAGPLHPTGRRARARPTRPEQPWRICQKASLLRVCAVHQRRFLSLTLLPCGTRPSVPPPSSRRPTQIPSPPRLAASDRPAPPGLHHLDANQGPLLPRLDSPS
jgi:hypothetical protein